MLPETTISDFPISCVQSVVNLSTLLGYDFDWAADRILLGMFGRFGDALKTIHVF